MVYDKKGVVVLVISDDILFLLIKIDEKMLIVNVLKFIFYSDLEDVVKVFLVIKYVKKLVILVGMGVKYVKFELV